MNILLPQGRFYVKLNAMENIKISVSTAFGLEAVTKRELATLGINDAPATNGRLSFSGTLNDLARCNVFLRSGDRVFMVLAEFPAEDFDALYAGASSVPWEDYFTKDDKIAVSAKSVKSKLFAVSACQSIVKKALADRLSAKYRVSRLPETGREVRVELSIESDKATISLDTSGAGLHKRGYRDLVGAAPLRETLAAGIILLSVWEPERVFIDPFCGSGTLPIEAAMIGRNIAPGKNRAFALEDLKFFDKRIMEKAREEARANETAQPLRISGFDIDGEALGLARRHAERAGVSSAVHLEKKDMREVSSRYSYGVIVTNPPYGERLMTARQVFDLYKSLGKLYSSLNDWSMAVITPAPDFERAIGKKADKNRKLFNSELECRLYQYLGKRPPKTEKTSAEVKTDGDTGQQLG